MAASFIFFFSPRLCQVRVTANCLFPVGSVLRFWRFGSGAAKTELSFLCKRPAHARIHPRLCYPHYTLGGSNSQHHGTNHWCCPQPGQHPAQNLGKGFLQASSLSSNYHYEHIMNFHGNKELYSQYVVWEICKLGFVELLRQWMLWTSGNMDPSHLGPFSMEGYGLSITFCSGRNRRQSLEN